jgi:hypothetical protein
MVDRMKERDRPAGNQLATICSLYEYNCSLENRARFMREVVKDVREAVSRNLGLILRLYLDERIGNF